MHHFLLLSILHPLFVLTDGFDLLKALCRGDGGAASVRPVRWLSVGGRASACSGPLSPVREAEGPAAPLPAPVSFQVLLGRPRSFIFHVRFFLAMKVFFISSSKWVGGEAGMDGWGGRGPNSSLRSCCFFANHGFPMRDPATSAGYNGSLSLLSSTRQGCVVSIP